MFVAKGKDLGELRVSFEDSERNIVLLSDSPASAGGKNEYFSPTDLVANALGGCVMMTLAIAGKGHGIDVSGMRMEIEKEMSQSAPRRIEKLTVRIYFAQQHTEKEQETLRRSAAACPVKNSLHPDMVKDVSFIYPQ